MRVLTACCRRNGRVRRARTTVSMARDRASSRLRCPCWSPPGSRLLSVAGALAAATILWMANARAIETWAPRIGSAASAAGPEPGSWPASRSRSTTTSARPGGPAAEQLRVRHAARLPPHPRYRGGRHPGRGGVRRQRGGGQVAIGPLFDAGAPTCGRPLSGGPDTWASCARTRALLQDLANRPYAARPTGHRRSRGYRVQPKLQPGAGWTHRETESDAVDGTRTRDRQGFGPGALPSS